MTATIRNLTLKSIVFIRINIKTTFFPARINIEFCNVVFNSR